MLNKLILALVLLIAPCAQAQWSMTGTQAPSCALGVGICTFGSILNTPISGSTGSFAGLTATGSFTATGLVTLADLATQATNTVLVNATSGTASPTAQNVGGCSAATNALLWTTNTGFGCNSAVNASTLGGASFAAPGAIGGTTAAAGKFTTLQTTSTITPSTTAGIVGTTLADNAQAGSIGEYISSTILLGSAVALTSPLAANVTSISLTAGDWDVCGTVGFSTGGTTVTSQFNVWTSTTSATLPTPPNNGAFTQIFPPSSPGIAAILPIGNQRISVSTTTTVYLSALSAFSTSTTAAYGFIGARRVR